MENGAIKMIGYFKKQSRLNENSLKCAFPEPVKSLKRGNLRNNKLKIMKK
ncbi:hypothetical protein [Methanosarcina siciliae]|nr:hypothetical protein [Methanosarcina siciliae]